MTKIIRVITRLNVGGPAIHAVLLSGTLNSKGHKDILVHGKPSAHEGDMAYLAAEQGLDPTHIPELGREISLKNDLLSFFKLYSMMKKEKPDIVHTHTAKAGTLGRLAAILAGVPVKIHTFHGHIFDGYFSPLKAKVFLLIERFLALFTDKVITVSDSIKNEIINKLKVARESKSVVIPLGFELGRFFNCRNLKGRFRRRYGVSDDTVLVGIVGRLVPIKNHKMFLDAVCMVKKKATDIDARFFVVGDGEMRSELEGYAKKLSLEEAVFFTGWIKDLAEVYADLDIVALTSLNEGTPVSLIEAMASSLPVIATDVGGIRDLVLEGENGLLVAKEDVAGFCEKLLELLRDSDKRFNLGRYGREMVEKKYSKERLINDIEKMYEECLRTQSKRNDRRE